MNKQYKVQYKTPHTYRKHYRKLQNIQTKQKQLKAELTIRNNKHVNIESTVSVFQYYRIIIKYAKTKTYYKVQYKTLYKYRRHDRQLQNIQTHTGQKHKEHTDTNETYKNNI